MNMTKVVARILSATVMMCTSCTMEPEKGTGWEPVSFSAVVNTKSSAMEIGTLDLLVFHPDGRIGTYSRVHGDEVRARVSTGSMMEWYLVANAPDGGLDGISSEQSLLSCLSRLSDNDPSEFVMAASGKQVFAAGDHVDAELVRLPCKITLESFTPRFLEGSYSGCDVRMTGLFLLNVVGSCPYSMVPQAGDWYNKMGVDVSLPQNVRDCIVKEFDIPLSASRVDGPWSFYCMPNPVDNGIHSGTSPAWSPRNTRLVLELSIDGVKSWYPIDLPAMKCNHEYIVESLILLGEGSEHPDIPVTRRDIVFDVSVNPWENESKEIIF